MAEWVASSLCNSLIIRSRGSISGQISGFDLLNTFLTFFYAPKIANIDITWPKLQIRTYRWGTDKISKGPFSIHHFYPWILNNKAGYGYLFAAVHSWFSVPWLSTFSINQWEGEVFWRNNNGLVIRSNRQKFSQSFVTFICGTII